MAKDLHVVMLPWSAFGHMMPFFQLSVALAKAGVQVSYIQTPKNIQRLPKIPPNLASLINFVELRMPVLGNGLLPEGAEATVDIPLEKMQYLETAYDLLQHPFKKLVVEQSPDWIIVDKTPHWAVEIAREQNIPLFFFLTFSVVAASFLGPPEFLVGEGQKRVRSTFESFMSPPHWVTIPSTIAFKKHEAIFTHDALYGSNATDRLTDAGRIAKILNASQFVAPEKSDRPEINDESSRKIFQWLDDQKSKSVVFVGFGSECKLSKEQIYEIAYGLELSNLPFLWALRKPTWAVDDIHALPSGFHDRTSGSGVVFIGWAQQIEILAHPSIGGSLFHCAWGSTIETLQFGHSPVLLPFIYDQPLNARFLVKKGLAVEIERDEDGSYSRHDIAKSLKLAMVSEEGEGLRARAREAAAIFGDRKLHHDYIGRFVEYCIMLSQLQLNQKPKH